MTHTCTRCGHRVELAPLPTIRERLLGDRGHVAFSEYVYVTCPNCGQKDWADERRYFRVLGPRSLYGLMLTISLAIVFFVIYLGFFFKV
jgi:DNA-directed RNA polymerase subunit RPC12/RpoP